MPTIGKARPFWYRVGASDMMGGSPFKDTWPFPQGLSLTVLEIHIGSSVSLDAAPAFEASSLCLQGFFIWATTNIFLVRPNRTRILYEDPRRAQNEVHIWKEAYVHPEYGPTSVYTDCSAFQIFSGLRVTLPRWR